MKKTNKFALAFLKKDAAESHKKSLKPVKPKKELLSSYAPGIPSDFELTLEFSTAFELMEHTGKHL